MKSTLLLLITSLFFHFSVTADDELPIIMGIGGEFTINSSLQKNISLSDYKGKLVMLYFGYTNCPDVCPMTTAHMVTLMKKLGKKSKQVQVFFLTVDPATDTPELLKSYLAFFDDNIIGLTGTKEQTEHILGLYSAEATKMADVELPLDIKVTQRTGVEMGYVYSHTARIYLIDQQGKTRTFYYMGTPIEKMKKDILSLLDDKL